MLKFFFNNDKLSMPEKVKEEKEAEEEDHKHH